jgi:hypothetical protein
MARGAFTACVIGCLLAPVPALAAGVSVTGDDPRQSITVMIEDATIDVVLKDLHGRYGFEMLGLENVKKGEALSGTMTGSLHSILERLLRNWNHMIELTPEEGSGVAKVMILNASFGAAPNPGADGRASGFDPAGHIQALSGKPGAD